MSILRNRNTPGLIPNLQGLKISKIFSGTFSQASVGTTGSFTITLPQSFNPSRSILIFNSEAYSSPERSFVMAELTSPTTIVLTRGYNANSNIICSYTIIEFASGVRVQRGTVTFLDSATVTVLPVNLRKCVPILCGAKCYSSAAPDITCSLYMSSATNLVVRRSRSQSANVTASYQVLEIL